MRWGQWRKTCSWTLGDPQGGVVKTISCSHGNMSASGVCPVHPLQIKLDAHCHMHAHCWKDQLNNNYLQWIPLYFVPLELQSGQQLPMEELHSYAEGQPIFKVCFLTKIKNFHPVVNGSLSMIHGSSFTLWMCKKIW